MKAALPDEAKIQFLKSGGYDGRVVFVIRLDGYIWLFTDYYGSCDHCDNFIDRKRQWTDDMLRKAYCFESADDALKYIARTDDFSWYDLNKNQVVDMIENPEKNVVGKVNDE